jgi:pantoate--beta-alanine ligase
VTDYAVVTDPDLGAPPDAGEARLLLAVRVGGVRLLDNARLVLGGSW